MIKLILLALCCGFIVFIIKNYNDELANLALICSGVLLILLTTDYLKETISLFKNLSIISKLNDGVFKIVLKIVGVGYLTEFTANILDDFGLLSLSKKTIFIGKIIILFLSIPIINSLIEVVTNLAV